MLAGKLAVVTGAKGGLGSSVTEALLASGAQVVGVSRSIKDSDFANPNFKAMPAELSSGDADKMAAALDGGKRLAELLRNLPPRNLVAKTGHERWRQAVVPTVHDPRVDVTDLYNRCRARWARRRVDIEADLQARYQRATRSTDEVLDEWE